MLISLRERERLLHISYVFSHAFCLPSRMSCRLYYFARPCSLTVADILLFSSIHIDIIIFCTAGRHRLPFLASAAFDDDELSFQEMPLIYTLKYFTICNIFMLILLFLISPLPSHILPRTDDS